MFNVHQVTTVQEDVKVPCLVLQGQPIHLMDHQAIHRAKAVGQDTMPLLHQLQHHVSHALQVIIVQRQQGQHVQQAHIQVV